MKKLKFSANLTTLFQDITDHVECYRKILQRNDYRFKAVEAQNPYANSLAEWRQAINDAGSNAPEFTLINSPNLWNKYDNQYPSEEQFENELNLVRDYVQTLNVRKVHLVLFKSNTPTTINNDIKRLLAQGARFLKRLNVDCLIEPLYLNDDPNQNNYYLRSYDQALSLINELNESNLKIMFDTYHCQRLNGNLCYYMKLLDEHIGHIQVSQVPLRNGPHMNGELNYRYIFEKLSELAYDDYIGLEYYSNHMTDTFEWLNEYFHE